MYIKPDLMDEAEELHNKLVDVITKRKNSLGTIILVLDLIKSSLLSQANAKIYAPPLSDKKPKPMWSNIKFQEDSLKKGLK